MYNSHTYVIIDTSAVDSVDFSKVINTSDDMLRYSVDGTKTFVKFEGDTPSFLMGEPQYDHSEILTIMQSAEWTSEE
jgi:hypothetical protein